MNDIVPAGLLHICASLDEKGQIMKRYSLLIACIMAMLTTPAMAYTGITINPVTSDNIINGGEADRDIPIRGTVAGAALGDQVTIVVNGVTYTTEVRNFTGQYTDPDGNVKEYTYMGFQLPIPGADLVADSSLTASVNGTDEGGNTYRATIVHKYGTGVSSSGCMAMLCLLQQDAEEGDCKETVKELWQHLGNGGAMPGCKLVAFSDMEQTLRQTSYPEIPYQCPDPPIVCPYPHYEGYIFDEDLAVAMFRESMQGTRIPEIQVGHVYDDDGNLVQVTVLVDGEVKKVINR